MLRSSGNVSRAERSGERKSVETKKSKGGAKKPPQASKNSLRKQPAESGLADVTTDGSRRAPTVRARNSVGDVLRGKQTTDAKTQR